MSTPTATQAREPAKPPKRHSNCSTPINPPNTASAVQTVPVWAVMASTSSFMPYCAATAQAAAPITDSTTARWIHGCRRT